MHESGKNHKVAGVAGVREIQLHHRQKHFIDCHMMSKHQVRVGDQKAQHQRKALQSS